MPPPSSCCRETKTSTSGRRLALDVPDVSSSWTEDADKATRAIAEADCAFGTLRARSAEATQPALASAPQAAPPAGWYYPEMIAHPWFVTISARSTTTTSARTSMAFVLAFARGCISTTTGWAISSG